jgi:hypothetical protein
MLSNRLSRRAVLGVLLLATVLSASGAKPLATGGIPSA